MTDGGVQIVPVSWVSVTEAGLDLGVKRLGVTQLRVSDLMRGKIEGFGLDTLVNMTGAVGLQVEMHISDAAWTRLFALLGSAPPRIPRLDVAR